MATPQRAIFNGMGQNQWYVHLSRTEGADLGAIKSAIADLRAACASDDINLTLGFGPGLLPDLTDDVPDDFQGYDWFEKPEIRPDSNLFMSRIS